MDSSNQGISLTIVTYDDIHQAIARQRDGLGDEYQTKSAVVHLSAADLKKLGLKNGAPIELKGKSGSVVVIAKSETAIEEGIGICRPACILTTWEATIHRYRNCQTLR